MKFDEGSEYVFIGTFNEGDEYWTIDVKEDRVTVLNSCWDEGSEELNTTLVFADLGDVIEFLISNLVFEFSLSNFRRAEGSTDVILNF